MNRRGRVRRVQVAAVGACLLSLTVMDGAWAGEQKDSTWGLARITQHGPVGKGPYTYAYPESAGAGSTVYVIGGGIDVSDPEFGGRASQQFLHSGVDKCPATVAAPMAAAAVGKTYGVARKAKLVSVRVTDCRGGAVPKDLLNGLAWAAKDSSNRSGGKPNGDVLLVTGGGGHDANLDKLVKKISEMGIVVVAGAGMGGGDACDSSPGSAPEALTVAGTTTADTLMPESTDGKCVKLLAPGKDIKAPANGGRTRLYSGNAMAAAYTAGVAALWGGTGLNGPQIFEKIISTSTKNVVKGLRAGTPNRLLFHDPA